VICLPFANDLITTRCGAWEKPRKVYVNMIFLGGISAWQFAGV
jgi:hypothetical protein